MKGGYNGSTVRRFDGLIEGTALLHIERSNFLPRTPQPTNK